MPKAKNNKGINNRAKITNYNQPAMKQTTQTEPTEPNQNRLMDKFDIKQKIEDIILQRIANYAYEGETPQSGINKAEEQETELIDYVTALERERDELKEINKEMLSKLFDRAYEIILAKYNAKINYIQIRGDGSMDGIVVSARSGCEDEDYDIEPEDLTADLDQLITDRKTKEEIERVEQEKQRKERETRNAEIEKERRKQDYEKLKQEFGD